MKPDYVKPEARKKVLLIGDDIRMSSGVSTVLREIVIGTAHKFNWACIAGAIDHPEKGKRLDLSVDTNTHAEINDSYVMLYPTHGYGSPELIRELIKFEKPDALMFMTDPRYYYWLFSIENEIRKLVPMIYLNIWDDLPYPMYNKSYYESCDTLFAISKQTYNINKVVLGNKAKDKVIKYIPHGINEKHFYPIDNIKTEYLVLQEFKKHIFKDKEYDFVLLWNSRNIRRKSTPDILLAWKIFIDSISEEQAKKCVLILHTQPVDENGTDLFAVKEMLFSFNKENKYNVIFSEQRLTTPEMNLLYNISDAGILISSNEGWGLSLTEAMMCGKPIIAGVTGGMQDQIRFTDNTGKWIEFTEEFGSNHRGKYKDHGEWAFPIFPSNISLIGSVPTPYIYDDRVDPEDVAKKIFNVYECKTKYPIDYKELGEKAREWVTSDESMMSARWMCKNIIDGIEETFAKWLPRKDFELIKIKRFEDSKHFVKYPIAI